MRQLLALARFGLFYTYIQKLGVRIFKIKQLCKMTLCWLSGLMIVMLKNINRRLIGWGISRLEKEILRNMDKAYIWYDACLWHFIACVILYFEASGLLLCSQSYTNDIIQELLKSLLNTLNVTDPQLPRQLEWFSRRFMLQVLKKLHLLVATGLYFPHFPLSSPCN